MEISMRQKIIAFLITIVSLYPASTYSDIHKKDGDGISFGFDVGIMSNILIEAEETEYDENGNKIDKKEAAGTLFSPLTLTLTFKDDFIRVILGLSPVLSYTNKDDFNFMPIKNDLIVGGKVFAEMRFQFKVFSDWMPYIAIRNPFIFTEKGIGSVLEFLFSPLTFAEDDYMIEYFAYGVGVGISGERSVVINITFHLAKFSFTY